MICPKEKPSLKSWPWPESIYFNEHLHQFGTPGCASKPAPSSGSTFRRVVRGGSVSAPSGGSNLERPDQSETETHPSPSQSYQMEKQKQKRKIWVEQSYCILTHFSCKGFTAVDTSTTYLQGTGSLAFSPPSAAPCASAARRGHVSRLRARSAAQPGLQPASPLRSRWRHPQPLRHKNQKT